MAAPHRDKGLTSAEATATPNSDFYQLASRRLGLARSRS
jgi:hypothetical protein